MANADLSATVCAEHAAQEWDHCDCRPEPAMSIIPTTFLHATAPNGDVSIPLLTEDMAATLRAAGYLLALPNPEGHLLGSEAYDCPTCRAPIGTVCYAVTDAEATKAFILHTARMDLASVRIA